MTPILIALLLAQTPPQIPCGPTGLVEKSIRDRYGENVIGAGVVQGGLLFVTNNPKTGTFTVMLRRPDGQTCVLMGGTGYATQEQVKPGADL